MQKNRGFGWDQRTSCCKLRTLDSLSCFSSTARITAASITLFSASTCQVYPDFEYCLQINDSFWFRWANSLIEVMFVQHQTVSMQKRSSAKSIVVKRPIVFASRRFRNMIQDTRSCMVHTWANARTRWRSTSSCWRRKDCSCSTMQIVNKQQLRYR